MTGSAKLTANAPAKKSRLKAALLMGAALALAPAMIATPASADTLLDAMSMAYQGNPNLLAARAQLRVTDESVPIALSGWRPTLSVTGTVQNQRLENQITGGIGAGTVVTGGTTQRFQQIATATFSQPVFRGFKTWGGTSQAKNNVFAQRARLQASEAQVLLAVAASYFDVLQYQAVVELNMSNVQVLNRQLEATQDRFRVGEITRTDVAQAEASLAGAKASLVQAEGLLQQSRSAYENVVGKPPENLVAPALPTRLPASYDAVLSTTIANNPSYIAADFNAKAADDNVTVVTGDLLPSLNLIGQYSRSWNTVADKSKTEQAIAGAQIVVPIYQSGAEYARVRQAKQNAGQQHLLAEQARLDARNAVTQAWENFTATTASIDSYQSQIKANEIALEGVQREAEVGSRTVLDVLNAEQTLLNSRVSLVRSQHDQNLAAHQVLSATGLLSGEGMGLSGPMYDPVGHYNDVKYQAIGTGADLVKAPAPAMASSPNPAPASK